MKEIYSIYAGYEGQFMYSISHWGMFPVSYAGWLPMCSAG